MGPITGLPVFIYFLWTMFSLYVFPQGNTSKAIPFTIFGVLTCLCSISMLLLRETAELPLQDRLRGDSTQEFDNQAENEVFSLGKTSDLNGFGVGKDMESEAVLDTLVKTNGQC